MKLIQRIGYYLGGFSLGLIILAFFLNGKKTSCAYGPEARVIKNISSKTIMYDSDIEAIMASKTIDTAMISQALKLGSVNFSESDTRKEPCGVFLIESKLLDEDVILTIENCDSIATLQNIKW